MIDYQVVWKGPVLDATGYGAASREYALALDRQGIDVKIEAYSWGFPFAFKDQRKKDKLFKLINKKEAWNKPKILICHSPPGNIETIEAKRFEAVILNTVWETTKIPAGWLPIIHSFDAVCVPCRHNIQAMRNSGVTCPIFLAPHGADTELFSPKNKKLSLNEAKGKFIFVSVFDFQHRKNPEALLKAYWEEFTKHDRVLLIIKTYGNSRKNILQAIYDYKKKLGFGSQAAPVQIITGVVDEKYLKGLYTLGNAFVLPTRGEGVGLPFIEALSSGIPVIATGWGGQMEFLNEKNSFLIKYKLSRPSVSMQSEDAISTIYNHLFEEEGQLWAEADIDDLKKQMRLAFENPALCKAKGERGRKDMRKLTWDKAGFSLKQAIEKVIRSKR
ncbi:glycosyltransferase involved in cell wall biosynthesis [Peribacillus deserti]|uniref:Glycosyltransferase involved in cell wall biosynthesis n=1 Tax=Peribacillus deserti TaxID=673318 RepID=A0ABS2QG44_9BACI|nr:glycosyltransferase involved in cell wall biosynthesis [Peribacillus deserti]